MKSTLRLSFVAIMMTALVLAVSVGYFELMVIPRRKIAAFQQTMGPSKILGKTPTQIISVYGNPEFDSPDDVPPKDSHTMMYDGPCWEECFIKIANGKAVAVNFGGH
jgi:hypothetical protein